MTTTHQHSFHQKLDKRETIMRRETRFSLCCAEGRSGGRGRLICLLSPCRTPPSFFQNTLLSSESLKPPADTRAAVRGPGGHMESKKTTRLRRHRHKEGDYRRKIHTTWTAPNFLDQSLYTHTHTSLCDTCDATVKPKPDFTSRPEGMSSCFPPRLRQGEKLLAAWQETPP